MYSSNSSFEIPKSSNKPTSPFKKWYQRWWGILVIILVSLILILIIAISFYFIKVVALLRSGEINPSDLLSQEFADGRINLAESLVNDSSPTIGPSDARVVVVEFGDFRCSACRQAQPVVQEILKEYGDQILFVWRDFPTIDTGDAEPLLAVMAGRCAQEQGKFWLMQEKLFTHEDSLAETNLKTYAIQTGLNSIQFGQCLTSGKYLDAIREDLVEAYQAGVKATPTFIINNQKIEGALPLSSFEEIIIFELNRN